MPSLPNPTRFLSLVDRLIPWLTGATLILLGLGLYLAVFVAPPDYQQGETVRIMFVHVPAAGHLLVGGRAAHLDARAVPALSRIDRVVAVDRGGGPCRPRRRHPRAGRRHQHPHHQILGGLVEHTAPAGEHHPPRRPDPRSLHAVAASGHGVSLHAAFRAAPSHRHARGDLSPARAHIAADPSRARRSGRGLSGSQCPTPAPTPHSSPPPMASPSLRWRRSLWPSSR